MTADGAKRLQKELCTLQERRAASWGPEASLRAMEQRIADLEHSLATAVVVEPADGPCEEVHFGATVTVREENRDVTVYRIVGMDEVDFDRRWVSWLSPLARALMNARIGERVAFESPAGKRTLEIVRIDDTPPTV